MQHGLAPVLLNAAKPITHHCWPCRSTASPAMHQGQSGTGRQAHDIAIVGSRNASANGRRLARQFAGDLGAQGITIVSGLARGIDTAAHQASLETGTIAVLAGGLDVIYPPENADLHQAIAEQGLLVSEMMPGTRPKAEFFPRRNRIISGLSLGTVVIEAAMRSGSLITARLAGEQGRDVFAVPGSPLDPRAAGTNKLIKDGATLVTSTTDILAVASPTMPSPAGHRQSNTIVQGDLDISDKARDTVLELLGPAPVEIDDLIRESKLSAQAITNVLLELEIGGRLARHPGQRVSLS